MEYIVTFLEGIISFISPCMLPMLPIYVTYFAGGADKKQNGFLNALSFVIGFTFIYVSLGLFAGAIGTFVSKYQTAVNIICGIIVILFGLSYLDIIKISFFKGHHGTKKITGIFSAFIFGIIFSVSHMPCIGVFLGSAIALATQTSGAIKGVLLLLSYSLGMGIPFLFSAILIDKLSTVFTVIKKHYKVINTVCGIFLIIVGIAMMTGLFPALLHFIEGGAHN